VVMIIQVSLLLPSFTTTNNKHSLINTCHLFYLGLQAKVLFLGSDYVVDGQQVVPYVSFMFVCCKQCHVMYIVFRFLISFLSFSPYIRYGTLTGGSYNSTFTGKLAFVCMYVCLFCLFVYIQIMVVYTFLVTSTNNNFSLIGPPIEFSKADGTWEIHTSCSYELYIGQT